PMSSVDVRTRRNPGQERIDVKVFFDERLPELFVSNAPLAVPGAALLRVEPFTMITPSGTWTMALEDGQLLAGHALLQLLRPRGRRLPHGVRRDVGTAGRRRRVPWGAHPAGRAGAPRALHRVRTTESGRSVGRRTCALGGARPRAPEGLPEAQPRRLSARR